MTIIKSFQTVVRLTFVLFSLYLLGDAFYRWDGFSYYASLAEFLPSFALAFILWNIAALFASVLVWFLSSIITVASRIIGFRIKFEHLLLYAAVFVLLGAAVWKGKRILWPDVQTTFQVKLILFVFSGIISAYFVWVVRKRAESWMQTIQDRITPLVWLFSIILILSVPAVVYHVWFKGAGKTLPPEIHQSSIADRPRPNIILISFDALAASDMSAYGYGRETTPFIRRWSKDATLFAMAEADSNFTTPAAASLMTGKHVWTHQTYQIAGSRPVRGKVESLPAVLKEYGYYNLALVVNPFASVTTLDMSGSFDIAPPANEFSTPASLFGWKFGIVDNLLYRAFGEKIRFHNWVLSNEFIFGRFLNLISKNITQTTVPPDKAFYRFLQILDGKPPTPYFAWIHLFPPHDPYLPPAPYKGKFNPSSVLRNYKSQEKLIEESYKYLFQSQPVPKNMHAQISLMRDYYDESVMYIDKTFSDFIEELNKRQIKNTVIILTADHGESFEHGYFTHGGPFLYEQVTHVPLIIKEPGQSAGVVVNDMVEQIDIAPTILNLSNIPVPLWMEGRSLEPLMRRNKLPGQPVFTMNFQENQSRGHKITRGCIAVREGDYKMIRHLKRDESHLFNLKRDPEELHDLTDEEPEIGQHLSQLVEKRLGEANEKIMSKHGEHN